MGEWPDVAIVIPTYDRALIVKRTVELLRKNLRYSGRLRGLRFFAPRPGVFSNPPGPFA